MIIRQKTKDSWTVQELRDDKELQEGCDIQLNNCSFKIVLNDKIKYLIYYTIQEKGYDEYYEKYPYEDKPIEIFTKFVQKFIEEEMLEKAKLAINRRSFSSNSETLIKLQEAINYEKTYMLEDFFEDSVFWPKITTLDSEDVVLTYDFEFFAQLHVILGSDYLFFQKSLKLKDLMEYILHETTWSISPDYESVMEDLSE